MRSRTTHTQALNRRPTRAPLLYTLAAALAIASGAFAWWSWRATTQLNDQLYRAARAQSEVLARDFSEEFRRRLEYEQYRVFLPYVPASVAWDARVPAGVMRLAQERADPRIPILGAFYWSSATPGVIASAGLTPERSDALRRRSEAIGRTIGMAMGLPLQLKTDADGNEILALTYFRKDSAGLVQVIGALTDQSVVARELMVPLIDEVARNRLGDDARTLVEWRLISPGGATLATVGSVDPGAPAVTVPFWRQIQVPDSAAAYRLLLAPDVSSAVPSGKTDPNRTPFLLTVRADPKRVAAALYGPSLPAAIPVVSLLLASLALTTATVVLARRFERHARERDAFATSVAHELRTPLTQILLHAETLQLDRPAGRTRQDASRVIVRETRRLIHLVENALQFVRGGRPAARLDPRPTNLAEVLSETLDGLAPVCDSAGARITRALDAGAVAVADDASVRQIVVNLIDNALRFGPRGQTIAVTTDARPDTVRIAVEDEGPGVPAEDRERVFAPFVTGAQGTGNGIGLAVVRQLAELQDGRAWIESGAGGGARVVVELPRAPVADRATEPGDVMVAR